ncbi:MULTISPECIES: hypothetical protein [unclassified Kitasatospora]|uniref:hypothetical protein n=1 Tax=unclassified Kitasatospora TaxID=2633591 RepID=UPI0033FC7307
MRANHATKPQEPVPRGVAEDRRGIARRLPRPRAVAAAGALLAQLWGLGAAGAYAASADPPREPARPAAHHAPYGAPAPAGPTLDAPALDGPALDGQSAEHPVGPGPSTGGAPRRSPGLAGEVSGGGTVEGAPGTVGDTLQEQIRAGGLPLPGQQAAVPDAFALASGLLDTVPAQARPAEARASREGEPTGLPSADRPQPGTTRSTVPRQREASEAPPAPETSEADTPAGTSADPERAPAPAGPATAVAVPGAGGTPETLVVADTATVTAVADGSATATAVLAPIAAGLLLTGAAMCKHRGLPRGH